MELSFESISRELRRYKSISVASVSRHGYVDNAVVSFAYDNELNIYFGSYSDTLKGKNISANSHVALSVGNIQIHGVSRILTYGSLEYIYGRTIYDSFFPQFSSMFEQEKNELFIVNPLVIWKYNPKVSQLHRDVKIFKQSYYDELEPYIEHQYGLRNDR